MDETKPVVVDVQAAIRDQQRLGALTIMVLLRAGLPLDVINDMSAEVRKTFVEALAQLDNPEATRLLLVSGSAVPPRLFEMPVPEVTS